MGGAGLIDVSSPSEPAGRALVTHSRSFQALAAIRSLGRAGIEVIAADEYALTPGSLSRHTVAHHVYPSPHADPQGFVESLEAALVEHAPPPGVPYALLPIHRETYVIARHKSRFERHAALALAEPEQFDLLSHKARLWHFARRVGVSVPDAWFPKSVAELVEIKDKLRLPLFVKVPTGASGIGIQKVERFDALVDAFGILAEGRSEEELPFVQALSPGQDYCTQVLCNHGKAIVTVTYRNVTVFPEDGGPGAIRETVRAPALDRAARRLLEAAQWHGIAQVDFRFTGDDHDEPDVIEVNPRVCGGLFQAVASGVDLPKMLFDLATTGTVRSDSGVAFGTRTKTPVTGSASMLIAAAQAATDLAPLREAWERSKADLNEGDASSALRTLIDGLSDAVSLEGGVDRLRRILEENEDAVSLLTDGDDPLPALGLVYPVAVLLKHGRIDTQLLTATEV